METFEAESKSIISISVGGFIIPIALYFGIDLSIYPPQPGSIKIDMLTLKLSKFITPACSILYKRGWIIFHCRIQQLPEWPRWMIKLICWWTPQCILCGVGLTRRQPRMIYHVDEVLDRTSKGWVSGERRGGSASRGRCSTESRESHCRTHEETTDERMVSIDDRFSQWEP